MSSFLSRTFIKSAAIICAFAGLHGSADALGGASTWGGYHNIMVKTSRNAHSIYITGSVNNGRDAGYCDEKLAPNT